MQLNSTLLERVKHFARETELAAIQPCCLAGRSVSKQALLYRFDTSTTKLLVERAAKRLFYCLVRNDM